MHFVFFNNKVEKEMENSSEKIIYGEKHCNMKKNKIIKSSKSLYLLRSVRRSSLATWKQLIRKNSHWC